MKKTFKTTLPLLVAAALCVLSSKQNEDAHAFDVTGDSWTQSTVNYRVNANFTDSSAGTATDQTAALQRAASEWKSAGQIPFEFIYDGATSLAVVDPNDGTNIVFYENSDGAGALATATWSAFSNGNMFGFDIRFYNRAGGQTFVWATNPTSSQFDIESIAVHEFGHALGMAHSSTSGATMFASVSAGTTANRTLAADDIAGVQSIYGLAPTGVPTFTNVTPDNAWIDGGERVVITGTDLAGSDPQVVTIGGIPATDVTVVDNTRIECNVPAGVQGGDVDISISHGQGTLDVIAAFFNNTYRQGAPMAAGLIARFDVRIPSDSLLDYVFAPSVTMGATPLSLLGDPADTRVLPLQADDVYYAFRLGHFDTMVSNFSAALDVAGDASMSWALPPGAALTGGMFFISGISLDPGAQSGIRTITNPITVVIQ